MRKCAIILFLVLPAGCSPSLPSWARLAPEQREAARRLGVPAAFENAAGIRFVLVPAGTFTMGSPSGDPMRGSSETLHTVTLSRPFYIGVTEVTQEQYRAVVGENPSYTKQSNGPVEQVSVLDIENRFLPALKARDGRPYALPTEAQWEYACRAGTTGRYSFGDDAAALGDYAWYAGNSGGRSHPVAGKKPNRWGLYDMHGNVWEWTACYYVPLPAGPVTDPVSPPRADIPRGTERVMRGGAFCYQPPHLRSAMRYRDETKDRHDIIGFRLVCPVGNP